MFREKNVAQADRNNNPITVGEVAGTLGCGVVLAGLVLAFHYAVNPEATKDFVQHMLPGATQSAPQASGLKPQ